MQSGVPEAGLAEPIGVIVKGITMNWNQFNEENNFEEIIFKLTEKSIMLVQASSLPEKKFSAFAFNCSSFYGDISLSFGIDPGYEDEEKQNRLYPPDWEYEVMGENVKEVGALWEATYDPIQEKYQEITESSDGDALEAFGNGFLTSLRRVMVRLEKQGTLQKLSDQPVWTLVTEIDADTEEEEQLLEKERKTYQDKK